MNNHLDNLLKELSFLLPNVSVKDIDLKNLLEFNLHNLQEEFQNTNIYHSFFAMLQVEIQHKLKIEENAKQDLEGELAKTIRDTADTKLSDVKVKQLVQSDSTWKALRDKITQLEYQSDCVKSVVADLNRKGISLNVLTARSRAELGATLSHS